MEHGVLLEAVRECLLKMAVARAECVALASKFRGCLLGALLGDCLGAPYEHEEENVSPIVLQKYFDKLEGPYFKSPKYQYTDDTAMTHCIAESFIDQGCFSSKDLAKRFVSEYFTSPRRGYGQNVVDVFKKLRADKFSDPMKPAREQFDGSGSYGNGGAMRVSPVALFCHGNYETLLNVAKQTTEITHTHPLGVNGALLQCVAVHQCLLLNPSDGPLDVSSFTEELKRKMDSIETPDEIDGRKPYNEQLQRMEKLLRKKNDVSVSEIQNVLGNNISAIMSVPTAIYSFLRAQNPIPGIETSNPLRRTIQFAISLGGDTDTIASMAGALAGAYYGEDLIGESLRMHCEGSERAIELANELYEIVK